MPLLTPKERLETIELGVWKVSFLKSTPFNVRERISDFGSAFPYFHRLALEVYTLEPVLAILFVLNRLWKAVEGALLLYLSSRILRIVGTFAYPFHLLTNFLCIDRNRAHTRRARHGSYPECGGSAYGLRCTCSNITMGQVSFLFFLTSGKYSNYSSEQVVPILKTRIMTHFELYLMQGMYTR